MFTFTPLLGAQSASPAVQSLLEFDGGIKVLVDVGWDETFNVESFKELERQAPTISIILLTHATLSHLGAFVHCCKTIPLFNRIPVYATTPVISLGRALLQDLYRSNPLAASVIPLSNKTESFHTPANRAAIGPSKILLPCPTNDEIAASFAAIRPLKYSQPHQPLSAPFSPPLEGLTITAYSAGHTLGGTIWHIQHGSESVVYAVDWNQARENTLSGAAWLGGSGTTGAEVIEQLRRPTALICSSKGARQDTIGGGWKSRDELLLQHIRTTISRGGNVLIPCDTSARVLELAYLLDREWEKDSSSSLRTAKLYLASRTCGTVLKYARSMLEWMDETVVSETEEIYRTKQSNTSGKQPFEFAHLKLLEKQSRLDRALSISQPKVFLASDESLDWGFSQSILRHVVSDQNNTLILVDLSSGASNDEGSQGIGTTKASLLRFLSQRESVKGNNGSIPDAVSLKTCTTTGLEPNELSVYQQYLARQRQKIDAATSEKLSSLEPSAEVVDDNSSSSSSSSDESDTQKQGKALNISTTLAHSKRKVGLTDEELGVNILLRKKDVHDFDVRGKKGREKMFPFVARRRRGDEFGDIIRPEEYVRAEEKDAQDQNEIRPFESKDNIALGQKRRWDDKDGVKGRNKPGFNESPSKRQKTKDILSGNANNRSRKAANGDKTAIDDSEESEDEAEDNPPMGPSKAMLNVEPMDLRLRLEGVDYAGLHDRRTLRMLVPLVKPQKLILTAGGKAETESFADDCRQMLATSGSQSNNQGIFTPQNGDTVDASVDTNAWNITLSQLLYKRLSWQNLRGVGIATVNGQVLAKRANEDQEETNSKRQKLEEASELKQDRTDETKILKQSAPPDPVLDVIPSNIASTARSIAQSIHVGDLRLAELRRILQGQGHTAEFKGEGSLLVDNLIAVRKSGIGQIEVEGASPSIMGSRSSRNIGNFFKVQGKIYEGLAVVSAR